MTGQRDSDWWLNIPLPKGERYMPSEARIGTLAIEVDGEWDIRDLQLLSESLSESYGLLYPLVAQDDEVRARLYADLSKVFWSGDVDSHLIARRLYNQIPKGESLRVKSFNYASHGLFSLMGVLGALYMMARIARAWIKAGEEGLDLWKKVDDFFAKRTHLRRPKKEVVLDDDMALSSDEARVLVFAAGEQMGFDTLSCDRLIGIVGNPIATLKYLAMVRREGRKLAELERAGLLKLPEPSAELIEISPASTKGRKAGVVVVKKPSRKRPTTKPPAKS